MGDDVQVLDTMPHTKMINDHWFTVQMRTSGEIHNSGRSLSADVNLHECYCPHSYCFMLQSTSALVVRGRWIVISGTLQCS
jgi:hypothetical protein